MCDLECGCRRSVVNENHTIALSEHEVMPVLRVAPADKGPLLVIVPSIFGIGPDVVAYARIFAEAGALVYVLDSFWRESPGPLPIPSGAPKALKRMQEVDPDKVFTDVLSATAAGKTELSCNGSVILLGICFGGQFVVEAAKNGGVQGLATWHGGNLLSVLEPSTLEGIHIEMDFGEIDPLIPLADVQKIQEFFRNHNNIQIRTHETSGHGFTHTDTVKYNANAAVQAKNGVLKLIEKFRT